MCGYVYVFEVFSYELNTYKKTTNKMCEVTLENFNTVLNDIKSSFQKAKFITIDTEFSALNFSEKVSNSLFDTPKERYQKLRTLCEQIIPMQIGISAFAFDAENNSYQADMYTFYVFPKKFHDMNSMFVFQSSSLQFLCTYNFDFNKFIYKGIPYINRLQETEIRNFQSALLGNNVSLDDNIFDRLIQEEGTKITKWINNDKESDKLILHGVFNKYRHSPDLLYFFYKHIRNRFNKQLWVMEENGEIVIKRVSPNEFNTLVKESNLEETVMDNMLGFTKVFRFLTQLKKPIIGHNLLTDIMIMYHRFENPLPKSYNSFKKEIYNLFPIIYDTKCITFDVKKLIPENKMWEHNMLEVLYNYFKDGYGRHLALNSPHILLKNQPNYDQFHNAGWDSYCTGYIFIRMTHICAAKKFPMKSKFMCSELFASTDSLKNCVNLIRCSVSHIKLDGNDPVSQRPPCLIIESVKDKPLDLLEISSLLSSYGFVEIRPYSRSGRRAIAAVDNFSSVRQILRRYKKHDEFQVKQYSLIKHSTTVRAAIWGSVLTFGAILGCLTYSLLKK